MYKVLILVVTTFIFFQLKGVSQLHIVKDNIACTYGLKNAANEWVVKPKYLLIELFYNNDFKITDTYGKGVLDSSGAVIIPPEYGSVDVLDARYYSVTKSNGRGIITKKGVVIVPPKYDAIYRFSTHLFFAQLKDEKWVYTDQGKLLFDRGYNHIEKDSFGDEFVLTRKKNDTLYSSLVTSTGSIIIPEMQGFFKPFNNSSRVFIGDKRDYNNDCFQNVGVMDRSGKIIVARTMEQLGSTCNGYIFTQNQKMGLMDMNLNVLLEPKYWIFETNTYERRGLPHIICDKLYRIYDVTTQNYGMIRGDGTIILKPNYSQIEFASYYSERNNFYHYLIQQDSKYGLLSENGAISLSPDYDTLLIKSIMRDNSYYNKSRRAVVFAKKEGKYGLLDDSAKVLLPFQYDQYVQSDGLHCLLKGTQITTIDLVNNAVNISPCKFISSHQNVRLYKVHGKYIAFLTKKSTTTHLETNKRDHYSCEKYGSKLVIGLRDYAYIVDLTNPTTLWKKVYGASINAGKYVTVYSIKGKQGLMHPKTGKLLLDTIYTEIITNYDFINRIWASQTPKGQWKNYHLLFDTLGNKRTNIKFDAIYHDKDNAVVSIGNKMGIIDDHFNWILAPKFAYIVKVHPTVYAVHTSSQKFGLYKTNKTWLADTIYNDFERVSGTQSSFFDSHNVHNYKKILDTLTFYWQLSTSKNTVLVNNFGTKITSIDPKFLSKRNAFAIQKGNYANNAFRVEIEDSLRSFFQTTPYYEVTLDTLHKWFQTEKKIAKLNYTEKGTTNTYTWVMPTGSASTEKITQIPFEFLSHPFKNRRILSCNKASLSIVTTYVAENQFGWGDMGMQNFTFEYANFLYRDNKLVRVALLEIFGGNQSLLETQLIKAIQKRDDLFLDCTSIEAMVTTVAQKFYLAPEGIWLYLAHSSYGINQNNKVLIPFDELKNNADSEWICAYL